jgi:RimJ/RimL family protein N-acetyltransferase
MDWTVTVDASDDEAFAVLSRDPVWNCFAIADLAPPYRDHLTVGTAVAGERAATLMVLDQHNLKVMSPFGDPDGLARLLDAMPVPSRIFCPVEDTLLKTVAERFAPVDPWQALIRMSVAPETLADSPSDQPVEEITESRLAELREFYRDMARGPFPDETMSHGLFVGIRLDGRLAAVAGTHVMTPRYGIAVVGGVLTRRDLRGRGLATAVTAAITRRLFERGCPNVTLNVLTSNTPAVAVYTKLGYREHCRFKATMLQRRTHPEVSS